MEKITAYYVLVYNVNSNKVEGFYIIPYLVHEYNEESSKPKTFDEFVQFVDRKSKYQFWSRCQYEIVMDSFPEYKKQKVDVYFQIQQNLKLITQIFINSINK